MTDSSPKKDFQVAVVGGGVCGLTCAIALHQAGVPVQLFEAAVCRTCISLLITHAKHHTQAKFGEIGAGIGVGKWEERIAAALLSSWQCPS